MGELSRLLNIGKVVEEQLVQVGVDTPEKLREVGAKDAWLRIKAVTIQRVFTGCTRWRAPFGA